LESLSLLRTVEWKDGKVVMIDQTKLPNELVFVEYDDYGQVADAIRNLVVRGAPAIGVSGAFGLALAGLQSAAETRDELLADLQKAHRVLSETRPTAVNLAWGLDHIIRTAEAAGPVDRIRDALVEEAKKMAADDVEINKALGRHGAELFSDNDTVMTHCNAGALATVAYGTALGVIRAARDGGKNVRVIATETRPVQPGPRLTAFELKHDGFEVSLIPDTAVGYSMANGLVDRVVVGADRVLRTGHVFNKIGTYQVATMARQHRIPFYVAAPLSTFDMQSDPGEVVIEMRGDSEVTGTGGRKTAPDDIRVINPAFDMTPPELISGIITEKGVAVPPFEDGIRRLFEGAEKQQ